MNDIDLILIWSGILIFIIGIILAFLRAWVWWKDHIRNDPLDPTVWMRGK